MALSVAIFYGVLKRGKVRVSSGKGEYRSKKRKGKSPIDADT